MERGSFYGNLPLAFFKCEICFRGLGIKQIKLGVVIENLTDLLRIGLDWIGLDGSLDGVNQYEHSANK